MSDFIFQFYALICEMAPYLLLGFFISGLLHVFVSPAIFSRYFAANNFKSVILAALAGVPLPLCSCGVIPTATSMKRSGASNASTVSFLISTPQTGVDSIAATYSLMGGPFAIIRPIAAFITGIFGGLATAFMNKKSETGKEKIACTQSQDLIKNKGFGNKIIGAFRYGFFDMVQDIGKNLVIGLIVGAAIAIFVPDDFFSLYARYPILNMLLVLVIAIPMYVCATGSIPIAATLIFKGLSPGAALVFLMAGPAVNMASVMVIGKVLGKKTLITYIMTIVIGALFFGILIDYVLPSSWFILPKEEITHLCHTDTLIPWFQQLCAWLLIAMLVIALCFRQFSHHSHKDMDIKIKVDGMTCNHCKANVEKAAKSVAGVESAIADLSSGILEIEGSADAETVMKAVSDSGYDCHVIS